MYKCHLKPKVLNSLTLVGGEVHIKFGLYTVSRAVVNILKEQLATYEFTEPTQRQAQQEQESESTKCTTGAWKFVLKDAPEFQRFKPLYRRWIPWVVQYDLK